MYSRDASGVPLLTTVRDAVGNAIQIHYSSTDITLSKGNERVVISQAPRAKCRLAG